MTFDEVRACLEHGGWPVEVVSATTMRSRFRGKTRVFHVFVRIEEEFVVFAVIPYERLPEDEAASDTLVVRLLRLNREMNMAKFSLDEDGDIVLSVEHRMEDLDPSEVRDAVDQLSFYADKFAGEIEAVTRPAAAAAQAPG
jgi:hypothetical protein